MGYTYAANWTWYNQLYQSNGKSKFQNNAGTGIDFTETIKKR